MKISLLTACPIVPDAPNIRKDDFDTEDSQFFITLKDIPIYQGEYTPLGKVIYGMDALEKIKTGNKSTYVLRPDYIKYFKLLD